MAEGSRLQPIVLDPISLPGFVEHVLYNHSGPSTLIICGKKDDFFQQLEAALIEPLAGDTPDPVNSDVDEVEPPDPDSQVPQRPQSTLLAAPTLKFLANSRTLKLAFCPDVTLLRAYLAKSVLSEDRLPTYQTGTSPRILAVLDSIALHEPTSSFSAQGFNRTFGIAVDAAHRMGAKLIMGECFTHRPVSRHEFEGDEDFHEIDQTGFGRDAMDAAVEGDAISDDNNLWEREVSILNVTTKSFRAKERGWVGRTVKIRTVAERWCEFESM